MNILPTTNTKGETVLFIFLVLQSWSANLGQLTSVDEVSVMAYNVENLFDWTHDEKRDDYTYLPLSDKHSPEHKARCNKITNRTYRNQCLFLDWSEPVVREKMKRIGDTILAANNGIGPDVVILSEVENLNIVSILNSTELQAAKYQVVTLIEGLDGRGIDVAVLSRFSLAGQPVLHPISLPGADAPLKTRGVLEVPLRLPNGEKLRVIASHFPSQANPHENRLAAVKLVNEIAATPWDGIQIAGGDLNITAEEENTTHLVSENFSPNWMISHYEGCSSCEGTHFYRGGWDYLDMLLFSNNMGEIGGQSPHTGASRWSLAADSIHVVKGGKYQLQPNGQPARFNASSAIGVSDHLPIMARIVYR